MARFALARQDWLGGVYGRCGQDMEAWKGVWSYEGSGEDGLREKAQPQVLMRQYWLNGSSERMRAFCRGSAGLDGCVPVCGRRDWPGGLWVLFPVLSAAMMAKQDWLKGAYTAFAEAILAVTLKFRVIFDEKCRMARMDWTKGSKKADDEALVSKTGAKAGMARRDWPKPLHESGRSLLGGVQEADGEAVEGETGGEGDRLVKLCSQIIHNT